MDMIFCPLYSGSSGNALFVQYGGTRLLIDAGKAALACVAGGLLLRQYATFQMGAAIGGLAVMLGHVFPALLGFKGGKGILSGLFVALVTDWRIGLIIIGVFAIAYFATQYVSLGSVLGAVAFGAGFVIFHREEPVVMICGIVMGVMAVLCLPKRKATEET